MPLSSARVDKIYDTWITIYNSNSVVTVKNKKVQRQPLAIDLFDFLFCNVIYYWTTKKKRKKTCFLLIWKKTNIKIYFFFSFYRCDKSIRNRVKEFPTYS